MNESSYRVKDRSYFGAVRKDILSIIPKNLNKVLEVGCGNGSTLMYLKAHKYCQWTCGVELFINASEIDDQSIDEFYQLDIEQKSLPIEKSSIDLILCLDVLEHLVNPNETVNYLHTLLRPNGLIIASIPNVRHYSVLLPLIFQGKWEYKNEGLLDSTHLRFFAKETAMRLMISSGLELVEIKSTISDGWRTKLVNLITFQLLIPFFELQYLVKVKKAA